MKNSIDRSDKMLDCTPGHDYQCRSSKNMDCKCNCQGANHGTQLIPKPVLDHAATLTKLPDNLDQVKLKGEWVTRKVWMDGSILNPAPSQKVFNHSPDGFSWGYGGSGPSQLALAVLLKRMSREKALKMYQQFKWNIISRLPMKDFETEIDLKSWLAKHG